MCNSFKLPGHPLVLQVVDPTELPLQLLPPYIGTGLSQERVRCFVPPPHVAEQDPHPYQLPHPPFTEYNIVKKI